MPREDGPLDRDPLKGLIPRREELGSGGPWPAILGLRGSPLEAPENTLASLARALDLGLDGLAYDVRACATGEPVLLRDSTLDRTTDGRGPLAERALPEITALDAGSWFGARFRGEPLALLEEALGVAGPGDAMTTHVLRLHEPDLVREVAHLVRGAPPGLVVRIASSSREACLEARDAGLRPMLVVLDSSPDARGEALAFVRDERIEACAMDARAWSRAETPDDEGTTSERWSLAVDEPGELLDAFRAGVTGVATREPARALAARALAALAPEDGGPWPVAAPELPIGVNGTDGRGGGHGLPGTRGEWCGTWSCDARVRNPFRFAVEVAVGVLPRHGAFEAEGVPRRVELDPGAEATVPFRLTGGSWRPGGDPLVSALYRWKRARGRAAGALLLDAPLVRVRRIFADSEAVRLPLLREFPGDPGATMILRRSGRQLFVSIENAPALAGARTLLHLDGRFLRGGRGVRALLPEDFDARPGGVAFSCGVESIEGDARVVRRWAGGIPDADGVGSPGRLLPRR